MASPQKENGYTAIANELLEMLILHKFTECQQVVIFYILRKTYGFGKKEDWISNSQFVAGTRMSKSHISDTLRWFKEHNVVLCRGNKIGLNKNWELWKVPWRGNNSSVYTEQKFPPSEPQKKKETITKLIAENPKRIIQPPRKVMPKKSGFRYNDTQSSDTFEDVIDADSGVPRQFASEELTKGEMKELIVWGESKIAGHFANMGKQRKAISSMLKAGYQPKAIQDCWERLGKDKFWQRGGIDFGVVLSQISKNVPKIVTHKSYD